MTAWSWKPDARTLAAIRRGDKINREYLARQNIQYQLMLIQRITAQEKNREVV